MSVLIMLGNNDDEIVIVAVTKMMIIMRSRKVNKMKRIEIKKIIKREEREDN